MRLRFFVLLALLINLAPSWANQTKVQPVITALIEPQPFSLTLEALGTLYANEAITISATVTDTVSAIHFEDGQRVSQNSVLVEMTSDEEHALLEEARFALEEAQRQYERVQSLAKTQLATESLLDERLQAYQSAQNQYLAMQSRLADRLIIAPFDGVLGLRNISVGTLVRPGDTITTLDDDSSMKLDISMPSVLLGAIRPGMSIKATTHEYESRSFDGKITAVDSRVDPTTRSIVVRARIPNPDYALKSGLLMSVKLQTPTQQALLLPEMALIQEGFRNYVYRVTEQNNQLQVEKVAVETGARQAGQVVIKSGLNAGDEVVTHGVMSLRPGTPISVTARQSGEQSLTDLLAEPAR